MTDDESTMTVLRFLVKNDLGPDSFFFDSDGRIAIHENCNDLFAWACADSEEITVADIPEYQRAIDDCTAARGFPSYAGSLWACRKRGERPQKPVMHKIPKELRHLFDSIPAHESIT